MTSDDYKPDLAKLEPDYQILTELHRSGDSVTYLARHLGLNRDVTATVFRAPGGDGSALYQFASDAQLLTKARHSNVIPVIEGRWLDTDTFAIVHARVRGSTLDQLVGAFGPMPQARVAETVDSIESALEWARKNGVVNRHVDAENVVVQQGSGRVLLAFSPRAGAADAVPDRCADARTIGRLTWQMLAGRNPETSPKESLAELRPELASRLVEETNAMMNCRRDGAVPDVAAFITLLAGRVDAAPVRNIQRGPSVMLPRAKATPPLGASDDAVVVVNRGVSFNTRLMMAAAVVAVIVIMAVLLLRRRGPETSLTAQRSVAADTGLQAAGDVALRSPRAESSMMAPGVSQPAPQPAPVQAMPSPVVPQQTVPQATVPQQAVPPTTPPPVTSGSPILPPETRRSEPPKTTQPALRLPASPTSVDSATASKPSGDDACSSPTASDQHTCLMSAIDRNDAELNRVYRQVITALRRQANVEQGGDDPETVTKLRDAQREWLDARDAACRDVGDGPLYARARAACFAEQSAKRTRELRQMLSDLPSGADERLDMFAGRT